jgi:PAS domain S-box-containing protein
MVPWIAFRFPLLTYWPAVEIIAYFFGFRPAMVSIGLSLVLGRLLFMRPLHPLLFPTPGDVVMACLFVLFSASLSMFMESLRAARKEAESNAALARDSLEQLKREMDLRQKERNWADSVLASIGDGVVASDGAGNVTYMNKVAEDLTGWSNAEAARQPLDRVFYTIDRPPVPLLSSTDGRMIPVEHSVSAIKDIDGNELGKVLVFRDISERRIADEALNASQARLNASLLAAGAAAWEWNLKTDEMICSHEFRELAGIRDLNEYLHFPAFLEAAHEDDRLVLREELASASMRGGEFRAEYRTQRDGEIRWLGLMGRQADATRMVGIVVDITERRRLEQKLREAAKQESLGVLSAGIAHDFNNLLTSIMGYASLLRTEIAPETQIAEYARNIEDASKRAAHLTSQMLAYSGQGRFCLELIDLSKRASKTIEELRPAMSSRITVELKLDQNLPLVEADPNQVDQVLNGTVMNAVEAIAGKEGAAGRILVATFARVVDENDSGELDVPAGRYVVLEVRDTGCGMDEATKSRIFDPFFSTKFTGRGLGLAAVLGIIRGHGGAIRVESAVGIGSIFQVFWPASSAKMARAT